MTTRNQSSMLGGTVEPTWAVIKGGVVAPTETPSLSVVVNGLIHKAAGKNGDGVTKDFPIVCANGTTKLTPTLPAAGFKRISAVDVANNGSTDGVAVVTDGASTADGATSDGLKQTAVINSYDYHYFGGFFTNNSGATQYLKNFQFSCADAGKAFDIRIWVGTMTVSESNANHALTGLPEWATASPVVDASSITMGSGLQTYLSWSGTEIPILNGQTCAWVVHNQSHGSIGVGANPTSAFIGSVYAWVCKDATPTTWEKVYISSGDTPRELTCYVQTQVFAADPVAPAVPANHYRLATLGDATYPLRSTVTSFVSEGGGSATAAKIHPTPGTIGWNKP